MNKENSGGINEKICRACYSKNSYLVDIFEKQYDKIYYELTSFMISSTDLYSRYICRKCILELTKFKKFKDKCEESLNRYYESEISANTNIKFEFEDYNNIETEASKNYESIEEEPASDIGIKTEIVEAAEYQLQCAEMDYHHNFEEEFKPNTPATEQQNGLINDLESIYVPIEKHATLQEMYDKLKEEYHETLKVNFELNKKLSQNEVKADKFSFSSKMEKPKGRAIGEKIVFDHYGGIELPKHIIKYLDNFAPNASYDNQFVNYLMSAIFTEDEMLNSSATGKRGSRGTVNRPALNFEKKMFLTDYYNWRISKQDVPKLERNTRIKLLNDKIRTKLESVRSTKKYCDKKISKMFDKS